MPSPELVVRGATWQGLPVDLLVARGKILDMLPLDEKRDFSGARIVEADGLILLPSLIDVHAHLREPGFEYKEDIASGLDAAVHGGFGTVFAMANTDPVNDNASVTDFMLQKARVSWPKGPRLMPVGALTKGLEGKELSPMAELAEAGCAAFSNDGLPILGTELMRRAIEYASDLDRVVIDHCEDPTMAVGAGMNEGELSGRLGLRAQPTVAESMQVARDILLSRYLDLPVHLAHVSCRESVELIAWGKARGARVSAETCPHYLAFTEDAADGYNTLAKVNPPLRRMDDVEALRQGLREGVIDMLATDHAPHADNEKETPFEEASNGISGLDTALSQTWSLVSQGVLDMDTFLRAWTLAPARVFKLPVNRFQPGDPADFVLFDTHAAWEVEPKALRSKGKNSPCLGQTLPGRVKAHFIAGRRIV